MEITIRDAEAILQEPRIDGHTALEIALAKLVVHYHRLYLMELKPTLLPEYLDD